MICLPTPKNTHTKQRQLHPDLLTLSGLNLIRRNLLSPLSEMGVTSNMLFPNTHYLCHLPSHLLLLNTKLPKSVQWPQPWWRSQEIHTCSRRIYLVSSVHQTKHRGEKSASAREKVSLIFSLDTKHIDMKPWEARNAKWETTAWLPELNIIIKFLQVPYGP